MESEGNKQQKPKEMNESTTSLAQYGIFPLKCKQEDKGLCSKIH